MLLTDRESLVEKPRPNPKVAAAVVALVTVASLLGVGGIGQYIAHH